MKGIYQSNMKSLVKALLWGFGTIILVTVFALAVTEEQLDEARQEAVNLDYFKDFTMDVVGGETAGNEIFTDYQVTVINGWGPWCVACVSEMPTLERLSQEYKEKGLQMISVIADYPAKIQTESDYLEQTKKMIASTGVTYPVLLADEAFYEQVTPTMNGSFPGTWVVDSEGNVIDMVSGANPEDDWRDYFDKWLAATADKE